MKSTRIDRRQVHKFDRRLLNQALSPYEPWSILDLLDAAAASPWASHRLPSISLLLCEVIRNPSNGVKVAEAGDLDWLLESARRADPGLSTSEDFVPPDPRRPVLIRWKNRLYRLIAGELERPIAAIERASMVGSIVDDVLISHLGFGIADLVELVLTHMDAVIQTLAPTWSDEALPLPGAGARVSEVEVSASKLAPKIDHAISRCESPERAKRALRWATIKSRDLRVSPDGDSLVGTTLAVRFKNDHLRALPVPLCLESMNYSVRVLAEIAASLEPKLETRFTSHAGNLVRKLLQRARGEVYGPVSDGLGGAIHSMVTFSERTGMAVQVVASLSPQRMGAAIMKAVQQLRSIQAGTVLRTPDGTLKVPAQARLVRVLVVVPPSHAIITKPSGVASMTLDDLTWIVSTSTQEPYDLLTFCEEFAEQPGIGHMFALETINAYEHWRDNGKCFHRAGVFIGGMLLELHRGDAEWYRAADRSRLEEILLSTGLAGASSWDWVDIGEEDARVGMLVPPQAWHLSLAPAVGVMVFDNSTPPERCEFAEKLANGLLWKLQHTGPIANKLLEKALGTRGLRLALCYSDTVVDHHPIRFKSITNNEIALEWDSGLIDLGLRDVQAVETTVGSVIVSGLRRLVGDDQANVAEDFLQAWLDAPPGLRIDARHTPQLVVDLPSPISSDGSERARFLRALSERLVSQDIAPGRYGGSEGRDLESKVTYQALLDLLKETIAPFSARALLALAGKQLEASFLRRFRQEWELGWNQGFPVIDFDPEQRATRERSEAVIMGRTLGLVVEEVLSYPPDGDLHPDRMDWMKIMSIAGLCLESGMRSEAMHYGLYPQEIEISESYEVNLRLSPGSSRINTAAFEQAHIRFTMPRFPGDAHKENSHEDLGEVDTRSVTERLPQLKAIDQALYASKGFSLDTLLGVLDVLRGWPVSGERPTAEAPSEDIIQYCVDHFPGTNSSEIVKAIDELTLRGEDLALAFLEHWEFDRRRYRLVTRPLIRMPGDALLVMPWTIEGTLRVFLSYLFDGRLPWPIHSLDKILIQALRDYRAKQNQQLERDIVTKLESAGYKVRGSIGKPKVLNLPNSSWHGEIDAVVVDDSAGAIWVIEAKDPYATFSSAQHHRLIEDFHEDNGYVDKLLKKVISVSSNPTGVAQALGSSNPHREWVVKSLMVTRRPEPAAFVQDPRVAFCSFDDVLTVVGGSTSGVQGRAAPL